MTRVVGIDPGISGALALFGLDKATGAIVCAIQDIPVLEPKGRKVIDDAQLALMLRAWAPDHVCLESVNCMPVWGTSAAWNFAKAFGTIIGVVGALRLPRSFVQPKAWQKHHGIKANDGEISRKLAGDLVPAAAEYLTRKKDHNRGEALLIALYGYQTLPRSTDDVSRRTALA